MTDMLIPQNEQELSQMIVQANAQTTPLKITGGGTRSGLGGLVNAQTTLSLKSISGITLYDAGSLTLVAKAGTPFAEIESALASEGQRLAFEPMDHRSIYGTTGEPTIGGIVAGNISGSRRIHAGACRDALIGVRYVSGQGEIIKNGGRVMKNVTGLDLVKLMAGSYGTLGVLSEVAFKTLPAPARQVTLIIAGFTEVEAVTAMSKALGSPFEVTGVAHLPKARAESQTLFRLEGFDDQVDYRLKKLQELLVLNQQIDIIEGQKHNDIWRSIRNVEMFKADQKQLWRLSVTPSDAPDIAKQLRQKTNAETLFDWGGGLIWAHMDDDLVHAQSVRQIIKSHSGHATLIRASDQVKSQISVFQPQAAGVAKLSEMIRQKFDPSSILNPNFMTATNSAEGV